MLRITLKTTLGELLSGPLANQFSKVVSLLADHLMTELGKAVVNPEQFIKELKNHRPGVMIIRMRLNINMSKPPQLR